MSEQSELFQESTLSLSDFHAKIYQTLASVEDLTPSEVACFTRLCESLGLPSPKFLSLRMLKDSSRNESPGLHRYLKKLPTLGYMSANGNCLILDGFFPKIESGYSLSDVLESAVDPKYFLSEKAMVGLTKGQSKPQLIHLREEETQEDIIPQ